MTNKIFSFTDLIVWQKAHLLVLSIYKLTKLFPTDEIYVLIPQLRRCAISITSNIAEGFSRKGKKEKIQFYSMSLGSLTELQNQLIIAKDLGYITNETYGEQSAIILEIHKMLNGLIKSAQARP